MPYSRLLIYKYIRRQKNVIVFSHECLLVPAFNYLLYSTFATMSVKQIDFFCNNFIGIFFIVLFQIQNFLTTEIWITQMDIVPTNVLNVCRFHYKYTLYYRSENFLPLRFLVWLIINPNISFFYHASYFITNADMLYSKTYFTIVEGTNLCSGAP